MSETDTLTDRRREIDEIDDQVHDLLMRRTEIVVEIGTIKRGQGSQSLPLRPGREAEIIRRLIARHRGPLPKTVLARIWRELLSAQVGLQGPFSVAVFAHEGINVYRDLARAEFGGGTPLTVHPSVMQVVQAVADGRASLGVLPMPFGERPDPWWRGLASESPALPRIIARLPFVIDDATAGERPDALAIANSEPEATGDDISFIAIELVAGMSRDRLRQTLTDCGLDAEWVGVWHDPADASHALYLVSIDSYLAADDPRLAQMRERGGEAVSRAMRLGGYARQMAAADIERIG